MYRSILYPECSSVLRLIGRDTTLYYWPSSVVHFQCFLNPRAVTMAVVSHPDSHTPRLKKERRCKSDFQAYTYLLLGGHLFLQPTTPPCAPVNEATFLRNSSGSSPLDGGRRWIKYYAAPLTCLFTGGKSMAIPLLLSSSTVSLRGPNSPVTMGAFLRTSRMCVIVDIIPPLSSACFSFGETR